MGCSTITVVFLALTFAQAFGHIRRVLDPYTSHPCMRPCERNQPMTCAYEFVMETYFTLSKACFDCPFNKTDCNRPHCVPANGVSRSVIVVNRKLPGPAIHVCEGDTVIVNVVNDMLGGMGTSIHWHGILQHGSQHMDGAGMVTQCPIPVKTAFEYRFKAEDAGTHYWHAHSGSQRVDGAFGALVVRQVPELEPHHGLYEEDLFEHTILVNDWFSESIIDRSAQSRHAGRSFLPVSILINGKGRFQEFLDDSNNATTYTPVEIFHVTRGKRYRFRTISNGAITRCPILISIDNHTLTMIASDGSPFDKVDVERFNIFSGERYDFVLNASQPTGSYWIRAYGPECRTVTHQVAILRYDGAPDTDPAGDAMSEDAKTAGKILNPWRGNENEAQIQLDELKSRVDGNSALKSVADKTFYFAMDDGQINNYRYNNPLYYPISALRQSLRFDPPQINHVTLTLPTSPPLTQYSDLDESVFCNEETVGSRNCTEEFCECVFRHQVQLNEVVEMVLVYEGVHSDSLHSMHLHGHRFYVVGMDKLGEHTSMEEVKRLDEQGKLLRNLIDPAAKDTVNVPHGGYTVVRFYADNPGFWFFHCHNMHLDIGMGLLIQVGDVKDMPNVPKNFPKCGNWKFNGYNEDGEEEEESENCASVNKAWKLLPDPVCILALLVTAAIIVKF